MTGRTRRSRLLLRALAYETLRRLDLGRGHLGFDLIEIAGGLVAVQPGVGAVLNTAQAEEGATVLIMGLGEAVTILNDIRTASGSSEARQRF